ncbi:MAG: S1C family serine protease, partial [Alicyclobacillus sp.]|nr:S1C family serine protease [Alicyclobacillus sp.]
MAAGQWRDFDAWGTGRSRRPKRWPGVLVAAIVLYGLGVWTGTSILAPRLPQAVPGTGSPEPSGNMPGSNGVQNGIGNNSGGGNGTAPLPPTLDSNIITKIYRMARPSVVTITAVSGTGAKSSSGPQEDIGTGFFIDNRGDIATNNHVVSGRRTVSVTLANNRIVKGTVVGTDALDDLAIVHISPQDEPTSGPLR